MADFSGFVFKPEEPKPEKKEEQGSPDFSGFSFKLEPETPAGQETGQQDTYARPTGVAVPGMQGTPAVTRVPTVADFDTDEEDVVDFILRRGGDTFKAGLVSSIAATKAEGGRVLQQKGTMESVTEGAKEDADYFDKLKASVALMNPMNTLLNVFTGSPFGAAEKGAEIEQEATAVRQEAGKDLQEIAGEADTTGKQIAFDVVSSAAQTLPAIATAPLGNVGLTLGAMGATAYFDTTQEALDRGESVQKARAAGFIDAFIEAGTERIPITTLFGMGKGKSLLKDALKFLAQEEGTELAATALQDLNAKLMYDPDMTWEQALENLTRTAYSTPFSAGLQAGGMTAIKKLDEKITQVIKGKPEEAPAFTPFTEEVLKSAELSEQKRQELAQLQGEFQEIMTEIQQEADATPPLDDYEENAAFFRANQYHMLSEGKMNDPDTVYEVMEGRGIRPLRGGQIISPRDMQPGEVLVTPTPKFYETAIKTFKFQQETAEYQRQHSPDGKASEMVERGLETSRKALEQARKLERQYASKLSRAQDLVRHWTKKYAPDMKVIIQPISTPGTNGSMIPNIADAPFILSINLEGAARTAGKIAGKRDTISPVLAPGAGFSETLAHEFGHALLVNKFRHQPESVKQAIRNDWQKFLTAYRTETIGQIGPELQPSYWNALSPLADSPMKDLAESDPGLWREYVPSFAEWLAHRMARKEGYSEETQKYFKNARKTVQDYWKGLPQSQRFDKSFDLFLKKLSKEQELDRVKAEYEGRVRRYRAAMAAMRDTATQPYTTVFSDGGNTVVPPTSGGHWGGRDGRSRRVNSSVDKFNIFARLTAGLTHLSDMNKHVPGIQNYLISAKAMWQDKMRWTSKAADVIRDWAGSTYLKSVDERTRLSQFLFEADRLSEEAGRRLNADEMADLREQFGISNDMYTMAERVWGSFTEALTEVETAIITDLQSRLMEGDSAAIAEQIREVQRDFAMMRNRNYMPHSRFGTYTVTGYAQSAMTLNDREFKRGNVVFFGSYATESDAIKARKELVREYGAGVNFGLGMLSDNVRELIDLPPALAQLLEKKLSLDETQRKELTELRAILAPGQSFRKRFVQRDSVEGYSQDGLRVFADYMQKFAGHLSRIKHVPELERAIQLMKDSATNIRQQGGNTVKREKIIKWYERHLDYMLDPGNELASYRAIGFLWYLGFNVKSAVVNATQVPMVTYPYLAQEYNDVSAAAAISTAMYQVTKAQFTEKGMDPDAARMVEELIERGIVDESLATELAALAEGGFLARAPGKLGTRLGLDKPENIVRVQKFFEYGALMFQAMEKMNRRITAVAAYNLARKSGLAHDDAVNSAHKAVEQTQYEYARFNRPEMMRGPVRSNIFMFWQYITNTLWFMGQNKRAAARYIAIMFLLGGMEGIPFMGNLLDLLDYGVKKLKEATGWHDPKKGAREFLWEYASKLDDDPFLGDVVNAHTLMNGYSSRMFGMYDLSASLQMGRIIPGTQYLSTDLNPKTEAIGGMTEMAGAVVNIPLGIMAGVWSDEPDLWKRYERTLPSAAKSVSSMVRYATRGEETDKRGAQIAEFNWPDDVQSWAELLGRGAGFQLTRVSEERERRFASYDAIQYYSKRHNALTKMLNYAFDMEDEEKISEALDRIHKFNSQVPHPEMAIQPDSISRSMKNAIKKRNLREAGIAEQMKYIRLQQDVEGRRGGEE